LSATSVLIRAAARADIVGFYRWLAAEADLDTAERFLVAVDREFARLAGTPGLGARVGLPNRHLAKLRKWCVDGFENALIFYEPRPAGVSIVRVIHAARDWWRLVDLSR
jgi:toxin ParE1/3/4